MNKIGSQTKTPYSQTFAFCESFNQKYRILDKIGNGQSANVFLIENKQNNQRFALKAFNHMTLQGTHSLPILTPGRSCLHNEIRINKKLWHFLRYSEKKGIPTFIESFEERKETLLVFELLEGDVNSREVRLADLATLLEDVAQTLASLHLRGFVHFDIRTGKL